MASPIRPLRPICPAWVFATGSNVHVCKDREWFKDLVAFESQTQSYIGTGPKVHGVGTIELPTSGPDGETGTIHLEEVLYAPTALCNILGGHLNLQLDYGRTATSRGRLLSPTRAVVGFFQPDEELLVLQLGDPPTGTIYGPSPFERNIGYVINATWPEAERRRFYDSIATQSGTHGRYSAAEKRWLKDNYGGEYRFLRSYGLSIFKEEDRDEGAAIVRGLMVNDEA